MIKRVVEIGSPARLHLTHRQVEVVRESHPTVTIPLDDLGVLILDHPQVSVTHCLLAACAETGVAVVACDAKHLPTGMFLPFAGHSLHAKVLASQADSSLPNRKRLWQAVVQAKIRAQAITLQCCRGDSGPLLELAKQVRSGDPENVEAQAAVRYWPLLFGADFRRDRDAEGVNTLLNYGYAIVRAAVARAIVGSGLHPGLGIHHCNQYNAYALADDLMEPLRPAVDQVVFDLCRVGAAPELDRPTKALLIGIVASDCDCDGRRMPFLAALSLYTASVARVLSSEQDEAVIPQVLG